jgi:predicted acetyltransferase
MYRVTDVPAALRQLKTQETGAFDLEVVDDLIPENCGPWHVGFSPSGVDVQPAKNADLTTDVRQLAQALLGEPSWRDLAANGFVVVKEDRALSAAEKLMPAMPATCLDFF